MPTLIRRSRRRAHLVLVILSVLVTLCLAWGNALSSLVTGPFVSVHAILEFIPMAAHFAVFTVGLLTFKHTERTPILFISVTALAVGLLDLGHTLTYPGMSDFLGQSSVDKSIYFWLVARLTEAVAFMLVSSSYNHNFKLRLSARTGVIGAVLWAMLSYFFIAIFDSSLPEMFSRASGLTSIKVALEVLCVIIWVWTGFSFYSASRKDDSPSRLWLAVASFIFALTGIFFISYSDLAEFNILMGHLYKAIAVCYIYRSMLYECITAPLIDLRKAALRESHQSESKSRFIATIGHELRTPLGVISGYSDILMMSKDLDEESKDWVGTIKNSSEQIRLIINDLLDLSKAESNNLTVTKKVFDLREFFDEVYSELEVLADKKGLEFQLVIDSKLHPCLESDRLRLKQIVVNLLSNAIKFTEKGHVKLACYQDEHARDLLYVSVTDSGIGIDSDNQHLLFKTYSQIENELVSSKEGTGLGLALSKKLTELLGGELYLDWSEVGRGSTFTLRLPIDPQKALERSHDRKEKILTPKFSGVHILIVDDAKENLFIAEQYLSETEAIVTLVEDPIQAVDFVAKHVDSIDVIFLDIMMPVMNGYEVCEKVRSLGFLGPILALSAHSEVTLQAADKRFFFDGHLMKPIDKESLWSSVRQAVLSYH